MGDGFDRANEFAGHTGDIAGRIGCDGIERTDEASRLWANGYAGTAADAGVPIDLK